MNDFLLQPVEEGGETTYLDILLTPEIMNFVGDTVIASIRTQEDAQGNIIFKKDTKNHTITSIQLYYFLIRKSKATHEQTGENIQLQFENDPQLTQEVLDGIQALGIGGKIIESKQNKNSLIQNTIKTEQEKIQKAVKEKEAHQRERAKQRKERSKFET